MLQPLPRTCEFAAMSQQNADNAAAKDDQTGEAAGKDPSNADGAGRGGGAEYDRIRRSRTPLVDEAEIEFLWSGLPVSPGGSSVRV